MAGSAYILTGSVPPSPTDGGYDDTTKFLCYFSKTAPRLKSKRTHLIQGTSEALLDLRVGA